MGPEHTDRLTATSGVEPRLRLAIDASIGWYEEVFGAHGIGWSVADGVWASAGRAPAFHSALVTVDPTATLHDVRTRMHDRGWGGLKDSFARIDATDLGMELLLEAAWLYRPPSGGLVGAGSDWVAIEDADALARWNAHAKMAGVLLPSLLDRPDFTFLERRFGDHPLAAAVLHATADAVELSNVHGVDGHAVDWLDLAAAIGLRHAGLPIVGFETGADLEAALAAGWEAVGPLRIWAPRG